MSPLEAPAETEDLVQSSANLDARRPSTPVVLATVWLVASLIAGIWLITGMGGPESLGVSAPTLIPLSHHSAYGGDAYTGIQNAASDTEQSLVEGVNELADLSVDLANATNEAEHARTKKVVQGAGILIVSLGVVNFTVAHRR